MPVIAVHQFAWREIGIALISAIITFTLGWSPHANANPIFLPPCTLQSQFDPITVSVTTSGTTIAARFLPTCTYTDPINPNFQYPNISSGLDLAAQHYGYDHFNWLQVVEVFPHSDEPGVLTALGVNTFFNDPPVGYLAYPFVDNLPFYWNEEGDPFTLLNCLASIKTPVTPFQKGSLFRSCHQGPIYNFDDPAYLDFIDQPRNPLLAAGEAMRFSTYLVGVKLGGDYVKLYEFKWTSTYTGSSGRVITFSDPNDLDTGGTGGVAILSQNVVAVANVPEPPTMLMVSTGLIGLLGYGWLRRKIAHIS